MKRMILAASHTAALLTGVGIMIAAVELGMVGSDSSAHQAVESLVERPDSRQVATRSIDYGLDWGSMSEPYGWDYVSSEAAYCKMDGRSCSRWLPTLKAVYEHFCARGHDENQWTADDLRTCAEMEQTRQWRQFQQLQVKLELLRGTPYWNEYGASLNAQLAELGSVEPPEHLDTERGFNYAIINNSGHATTGTGTTNVEAD